MHFLRRFQDGIRGSTTFRSLQVARGNYEEWGDQDRVANLLTSLDLDSTLAAYSTPIQLFEDQEVPLFKLDSPLGCAKNLLLDAVACSAKVNFALNVSSRYGFTPLADAAPYGDLLGTKYRRAMGTLGAQKRRVQFTDLSFAVFDELMPT